MIRFLNLKNQIIDGENSFAFYDTVRDKIETFKHGDSVFSDKDDFVTTAVLSLNKDEIERRLNLIPSDFFDEKTEMLLNKAWLDSEIDFANKRLKATNDELDSLPKDSLMRNSLLKDKRQLEQEIEVLERVKKQLK